MNNMPIERVNEVMDFDNLFPVAPTVNDAHMLAQTYDTASDTEMVVNAPTHTDKAVDATSVYTLVNPNITHYYDDILSDGDMGAALVLDGSNSSFTQNKDLSQTVLKNALGQTAYPSNVPRDIKEGQSLFAPDPSQITALYYRLIDQLSDKLTINELNLVSNTHGYVSNNGHGNASLKGITHNVVSLNDYFTPLFDSLYRTCINNNVLNQIRASYDDVYQPPEQISIQSSASTTDHLRISSLRQARGFIHGVTWLMFSTAMNNIFASARSAFISNWFTKVIDELTPYNLTVFDTADPKMQRSIDSFERLRNNISLWVEQMVIKRRAMLKSHPRYKTLHSPDGCITFFEAHRWLHIKAGEVYFESRHLVSTATLLMFSGYVDPFTPSIDGYQEVKTFDVAEEWLSKNYLCSMIETCEEVEGYIEDNENLAAAFEQAVLDNHRHYYPPSALVTLFSSART